MQSINVQVDDQLKDQLAAVARAQGVRASILVRQVLEHYLQGRQSRTSARQIADRLGLLGSIAGLPADLSTNPAHRDGFGE